MDVEQVWETYRHTTGFEELTPRQTDALLRMFLLASTVDDLLTQREVEELAERLVRLPYVSGPQIDRLRGAEGLARRDRLRRRLSDAEALEQYVDAIRHDLDDQAMILAALQMVAVLVNDTDDFEDQLDLSVDLGVIFGFRRDQITNYLRATLQPDRRV